MSILDDTNITSDNSTEAINPTVTESPIAKDAAVSKKSPMLTVQTKSLPTILEFSQKGNSQSNTPESTNTPDTE